MTIPLNASELKRLQKDGKRLDWMETHPFDVGHAKGYLASPDCWWYRDRNKAHHQAESLRKAIDAAISEEENDRTGNTC